MRHSIPLDIVDDIQYEYYMEIKLNSREIKIIIRLKGLKLM